MKRTILGLALAGAFAVPFAAQAEDSRRDGGAAAGSSAAVAARGGQASWDRMDANGDNFISRAEARRSSELSASFDQLDGDRDNRLAPIEFGAAGSLAP